MKWENCREIYLMLWEIGCKRSQKEEKLEKEKERKKDYGIIYKIKRPFNKVADEKQISKSLSEISERAYSKYTSRSKNEYFLIVNYFFFKLSGYKKIFQFEFCLIILYFILGRKNEHMYYLWSNASTSSILSSSSNSPAESL